MPSTSGFKKSNGSVRRQPPLFLVVVESKKGDGTHSSFLHGREPGGGRDRYDRKFAQTTKPPKAAPSSSQHVIHAATQMDSAGPTGEMPAGRYFT